MSTIIETYDASAAVSGGAPAGTMGDEIEHLKSQCGFIIPKIDWVVEKVTGWSLLEALFKPIAGDFNTVSSMQAGWGNVGTSLGAVGDNYDSLTSQLPAVWTGAAADAANARLADIAAMHADQEEASGYIQEQLGHVIEVGLATAEVVAAAVAFIDDVVQELLIDAAAGPLGWAKGAFSAPGKARKIISLINRGLDAIQRLTNAVKAVVAVLKYVNAGLSGAKAVLSFGNTVAHGTAGSHMDDTADQGF